jgi:iron complex outermembrane receptor protein
MRKPSMLQPPFFILMPLAAAIIGHGASAQGVTALEEVIVTAQKRDESVQQVPIAMTALTSDMLDEAGIRDISQINAASPSVTFSMTNNAASSANLQIRGIGTVGNARVFEGAVGVFIDGVYRSRSGAALSDMNDIESLEILRGPQGTLFGKNTSAGAILLRSKAPDAGAVSGDYQLSIGNYDERIVKGAINLPLTENSALRLATVWNRRDGFIESPDISQDYNDVDRRSVKAQYLIEPRDDVSLRLIADYSEAAENCCYGSLSAVNGPTAPLIQALAAQYGYRFPLQPDPDEYEQTLNHNTDQVMRGRGLGLDVSWEITSSRSPIE